ncbi:hypothetical protein [Sphingopyxis sp.]|uniref:hypothetical protein n=1 Tax=Sphingopyxis sp. TaxID=1908224 RepID=UPI0040355B00
MIGRIRSFIAANAIAVMGGVAAVSIGIAAFQTVQLHGFKIGPVSVEGCRDKAARFERQAKAAAELLALSEGLRAQEQVQDKGSYASQASACEARVSTAREAARTIAEVTKVETIPNDAAVGSIIGPDLLRRIIGQASGAQAAGLPLGTVAVDAARTGAAQ